ncbi:hypothetical protein BDW_11490 [Bdellovibrio bacteriovorus W]|nr:hypothetical protein BDW_11490 [Bdellovibrio bacteriovorus W]
MLIGDIFPISELDVFKRVQWIFPTRGNGMNQHK